MDIILIPGLWLTGSAWDAVAAELEKLPDGESFERIGDVVRALGYPTET